ncbi:MAG: molybdopterin-dependent oxidoreductase [Geminicoccaceae bacterium]|nr:molybdopterin-dependent oxidoreductase [Geminicoccaceae bacterium]
MRIRKELFADERDDDLAIVGKPVRRQDIEGHVTGRTTFFDDRLVPGLLHIRCVRSIHDHARIRAIDTREAERVPGVRRILRWADLPKKAHNILTIFNFGIDDEPALADGKVRYRGEPIVAIVAESLRAADEAVAKVRVDYDPLPAVFDVEEALKPDAPLVNEYIGRNWFRYWGDYDCQQIRFGDVEAAFRQADVIVEGRYQMSPIEHAPLETQGCIVVPGEDGRFTVYTCTQGLHFSLDNTAAQLRLDTNRLHFIGGTVGGGFGGKVDTVVEPLAVLAAMLTGRPVRYVFTRAEEMQVSSPRGAERVYITDGVTRDGRILARKIVHYHDAGAYSRLSTYGTIKSAAHHPGPYWIPNVWVDSFCVFTNRTPSSAMRGFGVTGGDFALESQMDAVARAIGMDPLELRIKNAYRDGDMKAHRKLTEGAALIECIQVAAELARWPLSEEARSASSRIGGGGDRGRVPPTPPARTRLSDRREGERRRETSRIGAAERPSARATTPPPSWLRSEARAVEARAVEDGARRAAEGGEGRRREEQEPPEPPRPASGHGALRFSSVFGSRRR